jgi:hypothetical protein
LVPSRNKILKNISKNLPLKFSRILKLDPCKALESFKQVPFPPNYPCKFLLRIEEIVFGDVETRHDVVLQY